MWRVPGTLPRHAGFVAALCARWASLLRDLGEEVSLSFTPKKRSKVEPRLPLRRTSFAPRSPQRSNLYLTNTHTQEMHAGRSLFSR